MRIIESIPDCAAILDLDGQLLQINSAGIRVLDLATDAKLKQRPFAEFFDQDGDIAVQNGIAIARKGNTSKIIASSRSPSGLVKWWSVAVSPIRSVDGSVEQILAISKDITDRKRKDEFLALERRMLETITSGSPLNDVLEELVLLIEQFSEDTFCCVLLLGEDGRTVQHSSAPNFSKEYTQAVHGLPVGPRSGSCGTAMFRKSRVVVEDIFSDPLWEGFNDIKNLSGGRACWSTPIFSGKNEVVGSFAIYARRSRLPTPGELELMDAAAHFVRVAIDKHRDQQALRKSEASNRAMLQAIPDSILLTSSKGELLDFHLRDLSILPIALSKCLGEKISDVIPAPLGKELASAIERVSDSGEREDIECSHNSKGEERHYEASIVICGDDRVLAIVRDVTKQKNAKIESDAQRRELAHLGRVALLGEITGTLAHELSQPLAIIRTNADVARKVLESGNLRLDLLREMLDDIIGSNQRAGEVIDRLRALLRKEEPTFSRVNLDEVVRDIVNLTHSEMIKRCVSVHRSTSNSGVEIWGDRVQLQQVVLNLLLNACDAMTKTPQHDRKIYIVTSCDGEYVELSVCDVGLGIPEDNLDRVFQPFFSYGKKKGGLGLGLAISRSIVEAHQGSIRAENNKRGGATFRCRFPVVETDEHQRNTGNAYRTPRLHNKSE
ncbi:ATP-binding protein [Bremerella sp.]|uniref:GAF domain-containing sensor histidine kinase n=1 Tax=Bremerella sp. TaxID=2795602 RepID=UPI00391DAF84